MELKYELRNGSYHLYDVDEVPSRLTGERTIRLMTDEVAIAFDRENGTRHKHGNPEDVEQWATKTRAAFRANGFDSMADDIIVVSGALPVDEINRCLSTTGYCLMFYQKLLAGELSSGKPDVLPGVNIDGETPNLLPNPEHSTRAAGRSIFPHRR